MPESIHPALTIALNLLALLALLVGLFFMFTGALGVARLPDFYTRSHAASKCITLGVTGLLLALVLYISVGALRPVTQAQEAMVDEARLEAADQTPVMAAVTKALLVLVFVFVSAPVGSHMLARAAHMAGVANWDRTLSDDLAADRRRPPTAK